MKFLASSLAVASFASLFAAGCAASTTDADADVSTSEIRTLSVTPGKFRLFDEPNHVPNPECERFTDLELTADGQAHLRDGLGGRCALVALFDPNERAYSLKVTHTACGAKVYEGARRVPAGPAATAMASIKITDNRTNVCKIMVPAQIVVEETSPGFPGPITLTMYSDDRPQADREVVVCQQPVDHGATIRFFSSDEGIVRAEYTETTIADTTLVSSMRDCSTTAPPPGSADFPFVTKCSDGDGWSVALTEGGFTGIPSVQLWKETDGQRTLVHSLFCSYVAH